MAELARENSAALPDAASQLEAVTRALEDALVTTDMDGVITSWNRGAERLYGHRAQDVIGQPIAIIFPDNRTNEEREILARVRRGESIHDRDAVRRHCNGHDLPIALTIAPIFAGGRVVGTVRVSRDLSDRQQADRAVRRLAAIVQSSDDAIVSKDLNGIVTSWNRSAERLFGYSSEEMIGQSIRKIIPADRQGEEDTVLASIRRGEKVDHFETVRQRKDGSAVAVSLTVSPIVDAGGRVVGASKIARDISERQRLEADRAQALAIAEENVAITERLNHIGSVVASALDRRTIVQAVTDAATELTGAEFGAFCETVPGDAGESRRILAASGPAREKILAIPEGCDRDTLSAAVPVRSYLAVPIKPRSSGVIGELVFGHSEAGRFTDRHERLASGIAAWASIALENARLYIGVQEASRLKDQFIATLSHELRTPLNAILGYSRMIRAGIVSPERQPKAVDTIERNATSLAQIVEDVLDVSRIISGKMRLNVRPVEVAALVHMAVAGVIPAADAKGIRVEEALRPDVAPVSADPERLQQIVWNLTSNAVKFTGSGGCVSVTVSESGPFVDIVVTDTGIGIAPAFLPHVFEPFRQADAGMTRERGGLGLGLNITRHLVEMHGGTIDASSGGLGKGSTFHVRLPAMVQAAAAAPPAATAPGGQTPMHLPDLHGVRVLAVDDDADALMMVREILQAAGAEVETAASAQRTLDLIEDFAPDVLVADIGMPKMDGFELIGRIRKNTSAAVRNVPAAALTAYARSEDRARALQSGFQVHLSKPIDPAELLSTVAALAKR